MKIPKIKINYGYNDETPVNLRYGKGYDGKYFFQVVILCKHGAGFALCTTTYNKEAWDEYVTWLNTLNIHKRLRKIQKIKNLIKNKILKNEIPYANTYKFKPNTLFTLLS